MKRVLKFGDFSLHEAMLELRRGTMRVHVQPKVLQVLYELAASPGRTVSSEELLRTVWPEETVTAGSIKRAIRSARRVLGDDGASQRSIRTVRGQGYRFILRVTAMAEHGLGPDDSRPPSVAAGARWPQVDASPAPPAPRGRRGALRLLEAHAAEALGGRARCVLLTGTAGMGKTAILTELARRVSDQADVWFAACADHQGMPAVRPGMQLVFGATAGDVAPRMPAMRPWLGDAIVALLDRAAQRRPVVLLLDDVHRAAPDTLELLSFVTRSLDTSRVMIALSMRPLESQSQEAQERLRTFVRDIPATCVELLGPEPAEEPPIDECLRLHARSYGAAESLA